MNKFLKYSLVSNFWRIKVPYNYIYRQKHDIFETDDPITKKNSKELKESSRKLLEKILNTKNEKIRIDMFKAYIKMNPDCRLRAISINYLLKSRIKKDESKVNVQDNKCPENKCPEIVTGRSPPKQETSGEAKVNKRPEILSGHDPSKQSECNESSAVQSCDRPEQGKPGEVKADKSPEIISGRMPEIISGRRPEIISGRIPPEPPDRNDSSEITTPSVRPERGELEESETKKCIEIISSCSRPKPPEEGGDSSSETPTFIRPKRGEPGEVIWGFIPKEWATFFVPITGHSGFYTFLFTFCTYLLSKEKYVCDHEYYNGISLALLCIYLVKSQGPYLARYLDKEIEEYEKQLEINKDQMKSNVINAIDEEKKSQYSVEGQLDVIEAKRENVHLQREAEYRKRQMEVYENVKRILDYQVEVAEVRRAIQHKNLISWVTKEVEKSITPELKESYMQICMADIERILKNDNGEKGEK